MPSHPLRSRKDTSHGKERGTYLAYLPLEQTFHFRLNCLRYWVYPVNIPTARMNLLQERLCVMLCQHSRVLFPFLLFQSFLDLDRTYPCRCEYYLLCHTEDQQTFYLL